MVKVAFDGIIESYQGRALPEPIKFKGEADNFENISEAKEAGKWPNEADILEGLNAKAVTAAKAAEYQKVTKDLKAEYEKSPEFQKAQFIKAATLNNMFTVAEAEALYLSKQGK